jgi:hypothetical protein
MTQRQIFDLALAPWPDFPEYFRDNTRFPYNIGLGAYIRGAFRKQFVTPVMEPGPREMILRGHFRQATPELVQERDLWQERLKRLGSADPTELRQQVGEWVEHATAVYASQLRAKTEEEKTAAARAVGELWQKATPIETVLQGAIAGPRLAEVTYQLALCKHEEAERVQARVEAAGAAATEDDRDRARQAWDDTVQWWQKFAEQFVGGASVPAARRLQGRAEAARGDADAARKAWQDVSGPMTDLEKLASLYRAGQLAAGGK